MKCEKLNLETCREFITHASKIVHEWNGHLEIFSLSQAIENSREFLPSLRTDNYYTENSRWVPLPWPLVQKLVDAIHWIKFLSA